MPTNCFAEKSYKLTINGTLIQTKRQIIVRNDVCYLSVDDLSLLLSDEYEFWQCESDLSVVIKKEEEFSYAASGYCYAVVKNKIKKLSDSPILRDGNLYLPVSFCARISDHYLLKSKSYLQFFKWT